MLKKNYFLFPQLVTLQQAIRVCNQQNVEKLGVIINRMVRQLNIKNKTFSRFCNDFDGCQF